MRYLFLLLLAASPFMAFTQGDQQQIALQGARAVHIFASFSSVSVTTGGKDAVAVNHILTADGEDRPDLRKLEIERGNGILVIREIQPTVKLLGGQFKGKGLTTIHQDQNVHGNFNGVMINAVLEVIVPEGVEVTIETVYGGIRAENVAGLSKANARYGAVDIIYSAATPLGNLELYSNYGAVDLTLPSGQAASFDLTTEYGSLLTDFDISIDKAASQEKEFYQRVVGKTRGGGAQIACRAPYGNVYLRAVK